MNGKITKANRSNTIKILNDEQISKNKMPDDVVTMMTSMPLDPKKEINLAIGKPKTSSNKNKNKNMEHYLLQNIKSENGTNRNDEDDDYFDIILADDDGNNITNNNNKKNSSNKVNDNDHDNASDAENQDDGPENGVEQIVEHVCGKCFKTFRRIGGLNKHLDFCRFDSGYHLRKAEMLKNLEKIEKDAVVMENKDVCFCCGESYDTCHLGHISCPDCPKSFKTQISYERHVFITHSENTDHPCDICNATLRSSKLRDLHIEQHKNRGKPYACKICGKDFTRAYHLKRHQKYTSCSGNESDSMNCKVCNKAFYRLDNLRSHLKQHLGTAVTKKSEYMCPVCKNCFYSLSTLNIHLRTHTGERPFDCDLCEKKFPSLVALKKHRRYHTGEKPYTCNVCNQSYAVKEVLNRHMKRHTGEKPHGCPECGKRFIQATQMRNHIKTHLRPFPCDECEEKFKTQKQLDRHCKQHKSNRKNKNDSIISDGSPVKSIKKRTRKQRFERTDCAVCEKNFNTHEELEFHMLKTHDADPKEIFEMRPAKKPKVSQSQKIFKMDENCESIEIITEDNEIIPINNQFEGKVERQTGANENAVVLEELIVDEMPASADTKRAILMSTETYTIIPLEGENQSKKKRNLSPHKHSPETKRTNKKSLGESLAAAIADDDDDADEEQIEQSKQLTVEDLVITENVNKLLDMLVDADTLKKFGWPNESEEKVLCKVIENCGHDLSKDSKELQDCDYSMRMREYVKLLFTVVIHNDSIKELLNNYPIDEVIEYVLGNDDDGDDNDDDENDENIEQDEDIEEVVSSKVTNEDVTKLTTAKQKLQNTEKTSTEPIQETTNKAITIKKELIEKPETKKNAGSPQKSSTITTKRLVVTQKADAKKVEAKQTVIRLQDIKKEDMKSKEIKKTDAKKLLTRTKSDIKK